MTVPPHRPSADATGGRRRSGRAQQPERDDPYGWAGKPGAPSVCPQCHAVYHDGRWTWDAPPSEGAANLLCQACQRIRDDYPAGAVTLAGMFVAEHMDDLILLVHAQAEAEGKEHPLNRIMAITPTRPDRLEITTTDVHLPRRIGKALEKAYDGTLEERFAADEYYIRVSWRRD